MTYKCKDCGKEFTEKVDYCSCGNNNFDTIEENIRQAVKKPKFQPLPIEKIFSWLIFSTCIILSFVVILFVGNSQPTTKNKTKLTKAVQKTENNIPNIENFWDNTPVKETTGPVQVQQPTQTAQQNVPQPQTAPKRIQIEDPPYKSLLNSNSNVKPNNTSFLFPPKQNNKVVKKNVKPVVKKTTPIKTVQKSKPITVYSPKNTTKPVKTIEKIANNDNIQPNNQRIDINPRAVAEYKNALLHKLFSKFVVGGVSGTGSCIVAFSINENGKLLNRRFVQKASNKSLNDAVYYMLMSVPSFSTPPEGINTETIQLKITYYNGQYEFSYR